MHIKYPYIPNIYQYRKNVPFFPWSPWPAIHFYDTGKYTRFARPIRGVILFQALPVPGPVSRRGSFPGCDTVPGSIAAAFPCLARMFPVPVKSIVCHSLQRAKKAFLRVALGLWM